MIDRFATRKDEDRDEQRASNPVLHDDSGNLFSVAFPAANAAQDEGNSMKAPSRKATGKQSCRATCYLVTCNLGRAMEFNLQAEEDR